MSRRRVLVLPDHWNRHDHLLAAQLPSSVEGVFLPGCECSDYAGMLSSARQVLPSVQGVYAEEDISSLLASLLCAGSALRCPGAEVVFRCAHKAYWPSDLRTCLLDADSASWSSSCEWALAQVGGPPGFVKPALGTGSQCCRAVSSAADLRACLPALAEKASEFLRLFRPVLRPLELHFPLAGSNVFLVQELVHTHLRVGTEAAVLSDAVVLWPFAEPLYHAGRETELIVCPGQQLSEDTYHVLRQRVASDAALLRRHGFVDAFLHAEYFCHDSGSVRLLEVNPRLCRVCTTLYRLTTLDGDNVSANVELLLGTRPSAPRLNGKVAVAAPLSTRTTGVRAGQLIDVAWLRRQADVVQLRVDEDELIGMEAGFDRFDLAFVYAAADTLHDAIRTLKDTWQRAALQPWHLVPVWDALQP